MNIKAVVFDYGQVISLPQDPQAIDRIARKAQVEREKFEPLLWAFRSEYDRGAVSFREYYKKIFSRLGADVSDSVIDELRAIDHDSWKNINNETVKLMEEVKNAGYMLGILSNMPHDFLSWARKNIPVFALPQVSVFSCEAGIIKPEPGIYKKLLSEAGLEGNELVFFDDVEENVKGARALGIEAFLWKSAESARTILLSLGVKL